jgi:hypothetical protein
MIPSELRRDVAKLKAQATASADDIGSIVLANRKCAQRPRRTLATLEALAERPGLVGRMARGDLRIGRIGDSTAPITEPETERAQQMGEFFDDPLGFVMWAFDWGADPALRVVKLPDDYRVIYDSEYGPEQWACEMFEEIGRQVREHAFDGTAPVDAIRMATASGHGISKSASTGMLVAWIMSSRPNARGVITASTAVQLESKTWSEVQKWNRRSITGDWFNITTGKGSMRMMQKDRPESWRCDAQTAREEAAESFAGLHAADSMPFFILDEASGVPDKIFETAQGGLTDGEPLMAAFGNPTRNSGWFFECFHAQRHRWQTRQIDSRSVSITNKALLNEWIADFGEESDFCKVRVRGIFPSASSLQFIPRDIVEEAMQRELPQSRHETIVLGCDIARFGDDSTVIYARAGRDARTFPPIRLRGLDTMQVAARIAEQVNFYRSAGRRVMVNIDGGGVGGGVVDRLRSLDFEVNEIQFGSRALDERKYGNRRAEIWGLLKEALPTLALPDDRDLLADLTSVEYSFNAADKIMLERKESMKARGLASPDMGDALALTLALPTPLLDPREIEDQQRARQAEKDYWERGALPLDVQEHDPYRRIA